MSNARNLARLLPNASGQLPTGNLQDAAVTNAKLVNGYPDRDIVTPVEIGHTSFGSANTYYNMASIQIPSPGVWRIFAHCRWGGPSNNGFLRTLLSNTISNAGQFTRSRMQLEQPVANAGNFNTGLVSEWFVTFGSGISYPRTVYIGAYQANATAAMFMTSDDNGRTIFGAEKIASTTSTGSSPVQLGS